uniref:adenosine deaminase domain-containing protein 1-like isoform X2 n=1 Tax=Myxine glutinosa TaxID=7769 RepID=UPI00358F931D
MKKMALGEGKMNFPKVPRTLLGFSELGEIPADVVQSVTTGAMHAVSALYHLGQRFGLEISFNEVDNEEIVPGICFTMEAKANGRSLATGTGKNKKEARLAAARLAIIGGQDNAVSSSFLLPRVPCSTMQFAEADKYQHNRFSPSLQDASHNLPRQRKSTRAEVITTTSLEHLMALVEKLPYGRIDMKNVAAFLVKQPGQPFKVVAIGTGDGVCHQKSINESSNWGSVVAGYLLLDSHAEIIARRAFLRYLYRQAMICLVPRSAEHTAGSIFMPPAMSSQAQYSGSQRQPLLTLHSGITFHLYLNQLPKGAASLNQLSNPRLPTSTIPSIRLHVVSPEGFFPLTMFPGSNVDDGQQNLKGDNPLVLMSSLSGSDKLLVWGVCGVQGSILSHFLLPIYLESITLGTDKSRNDVRALNIAVNSRVGDDLLVKLPEEYIVSRYFIDSAEREVTACGAGGLSLNWTDGDSALELVDPSKGAVTEDSPYCHSPSQGSRLCKAAMLSRFRTLTKAINAPHLGELSTYTDVKKSATSYREARQLLATYLRMRGLGYWVGRLSKFDHLIVQGRFSKC